ncbi:MAG: DUF2797 domain-containing protein [Thermoplasmata archaeon]
MFKSAQTMLDEREKLFTEKEVHVVSFRWNDFTPELKIFDGNDIEDIDLGKVNFNVSQEKICVGNFEGEYTPCPDQNNVDKFKQCQRCAPDNIPDLKCIFEPGDCDSCEGGFCEKPHVVYVAFHGVHPKVGMTSKDRFKQRMIEQGADAYALLATVDHRVKAREEEKSLSERLKIPQKIGHKKKLKTFSRKIDKQMIRRKYKGIRNRTAIGDLKFLNDYPITLPLRAKPRLRPVPGLHKGDMVGIKGKYLIYDNSGLQALNLSDLPGRKMKMVG